MAAIQSGSAIQPARLPGAMGPQVAVKSSPRQNLINEMRTAVSKDGLAQAVAAYLKEAAELPEEQDVLVNVLRHPDEAIARRALAGLLKLAEAGKTAGRSLLEQKVKMLEVTARDPETQELAAALIRKLR